MLLSLDWWILEAFQQISKGAIDMKFTPDVSNNTSNPQMQINQIIDVQKLCVKRNFQLYLGQLISWSILAPLFSFYDT